MFKPKRIYLDWAAAAPASKLAADVFQDALNLFGNPSSPHAEGRVAKAVLEDARTTIARLAGVKPDALIFTGNATEANALAILGQLTKPGAEVLYYLGAHASTLGAIEQAEAKGMIAHAIPLEDGRLDLAKLKSLLTKNTALVAIDAVCGETGTRFDTRGVRKVLDAFQKETGTKVCLHVDASQLPLVESFSLTRLAADTLSLDAQKVGGVRGIGLLITPRQVAIEPLIIGGGQERGLRPGTEATALAAAFATALTELEGERDAFLFALAPCERNWLAILSYIPDALVNAGKETVPHILNLSFLGRDTDYLAALLDEAGFAVSTRSACETDSQGSRPVLALTGDEARAASTLRISWGLSTSERDLARFRTALLSSVRFLDANPV